MLSRDLSSSSCHCNDLNSPKDVDPWQVCNKYAQKYTEELCQSWRDEVDKLLIFAGLFSGVVTGFAIESYHTVVEDPAETTVLLLRTIVHQLDNMTTPRPNPINLNPRLDKIPASSKRINTFWFLSLALSLTSVMAGILCLQWIREYERSTNVSHREDVALHHMRLEGLKKWQVFKILSALPLLLIAALLLFFAGFIELLWEVDRTASILVSIVVGVAFLFIILTTILPAFQCLFISLSPKTLFAQCPYKSPQAWVAQRCMLFISYIVHYAIQKLIKSPKSSEDKPALSSELFRIQSWPDFDTFLRRRRDENEKAVKRDVGCGLAWVGETYVQHQDLVEAVSNCLRDLDPKVALESSLAPMDYRRANEVRERVESLHRANSTSGGRRNSQVMAAQDLIVSHTLEHLAEKIEQAHMSSSLLRQRLELFLRINEGEGIGAGQVDCPVNRRNVSLIPQGERERVLQCINMMFEKNLRWNATHTNGAFEILFSMLVEAPGNQIFLDTIRSTLAVLFAWIQQDPKNHHATQTPEARLKEGAVFTRLILACKGDFDRAIVNKFRQDLDRYIESLFKMELDKMESPIKNSQYPSLAKYMASRG